jgi:hypothetical protein
MSNRPGAQYRSEALNCEISSRGWVGYRFHFNYLQKHDLGLWNLQLVSFAKAFRRGVVDSEERGLGSVLSGIYQNRNQYLVSRPITYLHLRNQESHNSHTFQEDKLVLERQAFDERTIRIVRLRFARVSQVVIQ